MCGQYAKTELYVAAAFFESWPPVANDFKASMVLRVLDFRGERLELKPEIFFNVKGGKDWNESKIKRFAIADSCHLSDTSVSMLTKKMLKEIGKRSQVEIQKSQLKFSDIDWSINL